MTDTPYADQLGEAHDTIQRLQAQVLALTAEIKVWQTAMKELRISYEMLQRDDNKAFAALTAEKQELEAELHDNDVAFEHTNEVVGKLEADLAELRRTAVDVGMNCGICQGCGKIPGRGEYHAPGCKVAVAEAALKSEPASQPSSDQKRCTDSGEIGKAGPC